MGFYLPPTCMMHGYFVGFNAGVGQIVGETSTKNEENDENDCAKNEFFHILFLKLVLVKVLAPSGLGRLPSLGTGWDYIT